MKTIYDLGFRECRWPICVRADEHQFCAETTELGDVYCPEHTRLAAPEDQRVDANLKRLARMGRTVGPFNKERTTLGAGKRNYGVVGCLVHGPMEAREAHIPDLVELFEGARL